MTDPDMILGYLDFVAERHHVYERRQAGLPQAEWSRDPILRARKFTNVFRVLDYGSQFLLRELLVGADRSEITFGDAIARCFLYRYTNRPEPWQYFELMHGRYPRQEDLDSGLVLDTWTEYRGALPYVDERGSRKSGERQIFCNAYRIFPPQGSGEKLDKLRWVVEMARERVGLASPDSVVPAFAKLRTMAERVALIGSLPRAGDFMGMQVVTDLGYSAFVRGDENEWIVAGPGAIRGASTLFSSWTAERVIRWAHETIHSMDEVPTLALPGGRARTPSLMDVQNTLCEWSKYVRAMDSGGPSVTAFRPTHPGPMQEPVLPEHW